MTQNLYWGNLQMPNGAAARQTIVENFNSAYNRENVQITVGKLKAKGMSSRDDFLQINRKADVLVEAMTAPQFRRYRARINARIPRPIQQMLTIVHRAALTAMPPIPMHIEINPTAPPSIQVTQTPQLISIKLHRPDSDG